MLDGEESVGDGGPVISGLLLVPSCLETLLPVIGLRLEYLDGSFFLLPVVGLFQ
jgi:hypothetical protein